jgi:hypothetical protein
MKKKTRKVKKDASKEDVRSLLLHLESEYRKANISEKHYKELKEKYQKMLKNEHKIEKENVKRIIQKEKPPEKGEIKEVPKEEVKEEKVEETIEEKKPEEKVEKKGFFKSLFGGKKEEKTEQTPQKQHQEIDLPKKDKKAEKKEEEITEMTPEVIERLAQQVKEESEGKTAETKEESGEKKSGFLKSIFSKKEKQEIKEPSQAKDIETKETEMHNEISSEIAGEKYKPSGPDYGIEIEKIKVMIDTARESGKVTDEAVRNISESIGEIRSMVFQADAELKENTVKMEKIEDEISEVRPQEIQKKFREINENFEKHQLELEKLSKKSEDSGEKINKVLEMLKSIGGIENLINVNKEIQKKLEDINEAMKYVERIGTKTEKMFIDLNKGLQDLIVIKAKQEDFNESLKDIIKNIDVLNVKFEGYVTKKDLDVFREDNVLIKKQIEDIKKILPVAELKLPENIINLRKEREDIKLLLGSLEEQYVKGKISKEEYEGIKSANIKRLEGIRTNLENEWKKIEKLIKPPEKEEGAEEVKEEKIEEKEVGKEATKEEKVGKKIKTVEGEKVKSEFIERKPERKIEKIETKVKKIKKKIEIVKKSKPIKRIEKVKRDSESKRKREILNKLKKLS